MSIGTLNPVGPMPAASFDDGSNRRVTLFNPFAVASPDGTGPLLL